MPPLSCILDKGRLFVREAEPAWGEPTLIVRFWATRFTRRDLQSWDETTESDPADIKILKHNFGFGYSLKFPGHGFWIEVRYEGTARADRSEEIPNPCPKVRAGIPTRYRQGRWEKCLKAGWTCA